jgi:hypothetical protein
LVIDYLNFKAASTNSVVQAEGEADSGSANTALAVATNSTSRSTSISTAPSKSALPAGSAQSVDQVLTDPLFVAKPASQITLADEHDDEETQEEEDGFFAELAGS